MYRSGRCGDQCAGGRYGAVFVADQLPGAEEVCSFWACGEYCSRDHPVGVGAWLWEPGDSRVVFGEDGYAAQVAGHDGGAVLDASECARRHQVDVVVNADQGDRVCGEVHQIREAAAGRSMSAGGCGGVGRGHDCVFMDWRGSSVPE